MSRIFYTTPIEARPRLLVYRRRTALIVKTVSRSSDQQSSRSADWSRCCGPIRSAGTGSRTVHVRSIDLGFSGVVEDQTTPLTPRSTEEGAGENGEGAGEKGCRGWGWRH